MLSSEARKQLLSKLKSGVCLNCGEMTFISDRNNGEVICTNCGLVQDGQQKSMIPDFSHSSMTDPTCSLSYGRSLGDTLPAQETWKVLAKASTPGLKFDRKTQKLVRDPDLTKEMTDELKEYLKGHAGLRARFVRIFNSTCDPPYIKRAITIGMDLCREFGLEGKDPDTINFWNQYGKLLRKVCTLAFFMKKKGESFEARKLTVTTFVFMWQLVELQHGLRTRIKHQKTFPSRRSRYNRGVKCVRKNKYKILENDWEFVLFAFKLQNPSAVMRKKELATQL
ncbi:MAG: TFIIB-type zinc ribbon-containing protein [Candidatus Bathyarchaeota archaeon]|nr:TFIIB-type zinc ribbon-containing protein [Candidatus Bathyarchaeota archaeon]